MVKKIIQLFHKQFHNINQAALILAFFTFFVQIAGLIRDRLLAGHIGPGIELDTYNAAFLIPDLIFALGASLVSVTILMPFLAERVFGHGAEKEGNNAQEFLNNIFTVFFVGIIIIALGAYILMPQLMSVVAPGFHSESIESLIQISRIMLLSPILLGLSNLVGTITQLYKKFFVYALSPILYNIGIIMGIVFLYPRMGIRGLALGVVLGGALHLLVQIPIIIQQKMVPSFVRVINWKSIWDVVRVSVPRTLTLSCNQIGLLVIYALASKMSAGTISIFKFSLTLQSFPIAIIGLSYSVAAFPTLVEHFASGAHEKFIQAIIQPFQKIIFWALPVTVLFIVLRAQIVRVILGTGQFGWEDTRLVAASLAILVTSVIAQSLTSLLVRAYYASGKTWRPLIINGVSTAIMIIMAVCFVAVFKQSPLLQITLEKMLRIHTVAGTEVIMLACAYALGTLTNAIILWLFFKKEFITHNKKDTQISSQNIFHISIASTYMGAISYLGLQLFDTVFNINTFFGVFAQGFSAGIMGIIAGSVVLVLLKNKETGDILGILAHSIKKLSPRNSRL